MKKININTEVVEMMIYFWTSFAENEKVGDMYLNSVADRKEMNYLYDDEFTKASCKKVLSAITNRELLNGASQKDKRFWNNNMWMTEDISVMEAMIEPMKKLNLNDEAKDIKTKSGKDEVNLIFVPGTTETYKIVDNNVIVNFFKISVNVFDDTGEVKFEGKQFKEAMIELVKEA